jgi:hypothetical protein
VFSINLYGVPPPYYHGNQIYYELTFDPPNNHTATPYLARGTIETGVRVKGTEEGGGTKLSGLGIFGIVAGGVLLFGGVGYLVTRYRRYRERRDHRVS